MDRRPPDFDRAEAGPSDPELPDAAPLPQPVDAPPPAPAPARLILAPMGDSFTAVVGMRSEERMFFVLNAGDAPAGALDVDVTGPNPDEFVASASGCEGGLEAQATCALLVVFAPRSPGDKTGTLTVSAASGGRATALLTGRAVEPTVTWTITPSSVDFGPIPVNQTGPERVLSASNAGNVPSGRPTVTITGPSARDFQVSHDDCGPGLPPGGACRITVRFAPSASGDRTAWLVLSSPPGGVAMARLGGLGILACTITTVPSAGQFRETVVGQTSEELDFRHTVPPMARPLRASLTGSEKDEFEIVEHACAPGEEACRTRVRFRPTAVGVRDAVLVLTGSSCVGSVSLQGRGVSSVP